MKKTLRCCISCILPCGALDVIRIVHSNGRVEEISGSIRASEVMKAHPKHILKKPLSHSSFDQVSGMVSRIVVVPPDAQLQRGKIYFLMPQLQPSTTNPSSSSSSPADQQKAAGVRRSSSSSSSSSSRRKKRRDHRQGVGGESGGGNSISEVSGSTTSDHNNLLISDRYLSEILREKVLSQKDRRRGRVGVWRPHLESISETLSEAASSN